MMASLLGPSVYCCCSILRPTPLSYSTSTDRSYILYGSVTRLGYRFLSPWKGLKHLSISFRRNLMYLENKEKPNRMAVYASLFGVGAPEALVIGVVALLVFGPKGLAEVARNLGKTLRSFQPTIRELQEVSREFKSSFEREIGLDEMNSTINNSAFRSSSAVNESQQAVSDPNGRPVAEPQELMKRTEELSATTKSQADSLEEQPRDGRPAAESPELMKTTEELPATTRSQADSPEEQPRETNTTEATTSDSVHSEESASVSVEAKDQASALQ